MIQMGKDNLIEGIEEAIKKMISEMHIEPKTIRLNPKDVRKIELERIIYSPTVLSCVINKICGLRITETTKVQEGTAEIYNDKLFYEVKNDNK